MVFAGAVLLVLVQGLVGLWTSSEIEHDLAHVQKAVLHEAVAADGMMHTLAGLESVLVTAESSAPISSSQFRQRGADLFQEFRVQFTEATNASRWAIEILHANEAAELNTEREQLARLLKVSAMMQRVESKWREAADCMDSDPARAETIRESILLPTLNGQLRPAITAYDQDLEHELIREVEKSFTESQQSQRIILVLAAFIGCIVLAGMIYVMRLILSPLREFDKVARAIVSGDRQCRLMIHQKDEIGDAAQMFNRMLDTLHATTVSRDDLEKQVAERTGELEQEIKGRQMAIAQLDRFFSLSRDAMCIEDFSGKLLRVNGSFAEILGYTPAELVALPPHERICAEDLPAFEAGLRMLVSGEKDSVSFDLRGRTKNGSCRIMSWRLFVAREDKLIYATGRDVTERRQMLAALRKSEQNLATTLNSIGDGVLTTDAEGRVVRLNPVAEQLTGWKNTEAAGRPIDEVFHIVHEQSRERATIPVANVLATGKIAALANHTILIRRDGHEFPIADSCAPIREENGGITGAVLVFRDVSKERADENALRERETLLRNLTNNLPNGATYRMINSVNGGYHFQHVSESIKRIAGVTAEAVCADASVLFSLILEKDRKRADAVGESARLAEKQFDCQTRIRTARGEIKWLHWRSMPSRLPSGDIAWDGLVVDITPLKFAESELWRLNEDLETTVRERSAALFESERRHRTLLANLPGLAYRCRNDQARTMEFISEGCRALMGIRSEAFVNHQISYESFVHLEDRERIWNEIQQAVAKKIPFTLEYRIRNVSGGWLFVWEQGRAIFDEQEQVVALEGFISDVTERVNAEQSRRSLEEQLRQAQKLEAIGTLAGGIAHDFNNILAAIMGSAELVKMDITPEHPSYEFMEQILLAGNRAKDLVQQILTFSKRTETSRLVINLRPIVKECVKLLRATIPPMVEINSDINPQTPPVLGDPTQMHQIIMNLCTNAWHALPERNGRIHLKLDAVEVDDLMVSSHPEFSAGPYVRLSVCDNGSGISPETMSRIFEPFFTTKSSGKGTGLGLSVVHGIVKAHRGVVVVESELGKGSVFSVYLPAEKNHALELASENTDPLRGNDERVLLVDDEELPGRTVEKLMSRLGYQVTRFTQPERALFDFSSSPKSYDLVITDHAMPGMSGSDLASALLKIRRDIPILVITGMADPMVHAQAKQNGVRSVLSKPLTSEVLAREIAGIFDKSIAI